VQARISQSSAVRAVLATRSLKPKRSRTKTPEMTPRVVEVVVKTAALLRMGSWQKFDVVFFVTAVQRGSRLC